MHSSPTIPSNPRNARRARRLGAALLGAAALAALMLPLARARAEKEIESAGLALLDGLEPALAASPQAAVVNGQRMYLASRVTAIAVPDVLERLERQCGSLFRRRSAPDDRVGQLACFAGSAEPRASLFDAALEFAASGDVSRLGDARYAIARRDAPSSMTHVLALWTEGPFEPSAMFPADADAPGGDSELLPRPAESRRILVARMVDRRDGLRLYRTRRGPTEILEQYARELPARGFDAPASSELERIEPRLREASRAFVGHDALLLVVARRGAGEHTLVSLIEIGSPGHAGALGEEAR